MIVVSDTSPINYLLAIGEVDVLTALFNTVVIPATVYDELNASGAPERNRQWLANVPVGFQVRAATRVDPALDLDRGEAEAISLTEEWPRGSARARLDNYRHSRRCRARLGAWTP